MRRRAPRRMLAVGGFALFVAVIVGIAVAPDLGGASAGVSPAALNRIAQKNDRASDEASARMRDESRAQAVQTDALRAAEERRGVQAEAMLARSDDSEAGRTNQPDAVQ